MCTIGCMYLEHVDGRWLRQYRYGQRWRWSSVERPEQQQHLLPAATDPEPPAGMPKGQGRRRKEGGIGTAMHAHAGWQGRLHTGKATTVHTALHRSAPARRASCVLPWDGCRQSLRRAAHPTWPIPSLDQGDVWSLQPCGLGRRAYTTTGPMARRCRRNPAKGVQTGALQARMTAKLRSCLALLYQPCFALPCLGGRLSGLLSAGLRQHRRASLADAQRDAEFHVAGCRCAVGCGWRGVGSCRDDWKSLERAWGAIT
jgi:hypothetical protein